MDNNMKPEEKNTAEIKSQIFKELVLAKENKRPDKIINTYEGYAAKYGRDVANSEILCLVAEAYAELNQYKKAAKVCDYALAYCGGRSYLPIRELRFKIMSRLCERG